MRKKLLLALLAFPCLVWGQTATSDNLAIELSDLKRQLNDTRSWNNELEESVIKLENQINLVSDSLKTLLAKNRDLQDQLMSNLLTQSQNEKAVNLALDEFSKKFEEQNQTMDGVKASLEQQGNQQLLFYLGGLVIFTLALFIGIRLSTRSAIKRHVKSWNDFDEHIIKR